MSINERGPIVVIGMLGATLDAGSDEKRWAKWRPTVSLFQHEDLIVDRFELLYQSKFERLAGQVVADIENISPETTTRLHNLSISDPWEFESVFTALYEFATSYDFKDSEQYFLHISTGTHVIQICNFLLVESGILPAKIIQTGPPNKRSSRVGVYKLIDLDLEKYDVIAERFAQQVEARVSVLKSGVETKNVSFNALIDDIERVALASKAPMLFTGPTGAGKTQLARRVFSIKQDVQDLPGEFVEINCATLKGQHAMATLFGHTKGAFTGASSARPGLLKKANNGCLFLDEIGELGLDEQAMLLRALESKIFYPVGSDKEVRSDFQLIAGTNRDLREKVRAGEFREDLLARIDLWSFLLPGLAQRREDIAPNIDFELYVFERDNGRRVRFNVEARQKYEAFSLSQTATWRANFRDLNASMTRMATFASSGRITVEIVDAEVQRLKRGWGEETGPSSELVDQFLGSERAKALDRFDRVQLNDTLAVCFRSASLSEAGRELFAVSRAKKTNPNDSDRIRKYLQRFDISWSDIRAFVKTG